MDNHTIKQQKRVGLIPKIALVVSLVIVFCFLIFVASSCVISAHPNEWLLVISRSGEMKSSGVGTTEFLGLFDKAVKFPAVIRKVRFSAQQVSKEMQGIEVSGFLVWAINRVGDGPFKAYRYGMVGTDELTHQADSNIRGMAESIVRHQVANLNLHQVIANRELLRNTVREEMQKVIQGWGMWLETVEVTDVRVLSQKVFDDLQVEFRQDIHSKAEKIRMNTFRDIELQRIVQNQELQQTRAESEARQATRDLWIQLEAKKQEAQYQEETSKLSLERLERDRLFALQESKNEAELKQLQLEEEMKLEMKKAQNDLNIEKQRMEIERDTPQATMQKAMMNTIREVYSNLPIREVKLFNSGSNNGLDGILPGLAQIAEMMQKNK